MAHMTDYIALTRRVAVSMIQSTEVTKCKLMIIEHLSMQINDGETTKYALNDSLSASLCVRVECAC